MKRQDDDFYMASNKCPACGKHLIREHDAEGRQTCLRELRRRQDDMELLRQLRWLMANSDGVIGLRFDGEVTPWRDVADLYAPALRSILRPE